jgi:hypothetical protein
MTGVFLSTQGLFLFVCGFASGFVFRRPNPKTARQSGFAALKSASAAGNDPPWGEIAQTDGDAALTPQLLNLHEALLHPERSAAAQAIAKTRAPV